MRWCHREILFPRPIFKKFYQRLKSVKDSNQNPEKDFLMAVNLVQHTTFSEIAIGMELVLETESQNLFEDLREIVIGERRPANVVEIASRYNQEPLVPTLNVYDELIPNLESERRSGNN